MHTCIVDDCHHAVSTMLLTCTACHRRLVQALNAAPQAYSECAQALTGKSDEKIRARRTNWQFRGIALSASVVDARGLLLSRLASWSGLISNERRVTPPGREISELTSFLLRHDDWLCAHPAAGDAIGEITDSVRNARRVSRGSGTRVFEVGRCVMTECDGSLLATLEGEHSRRPSAVACSADASHRWSSDQWYDLSRRVTEHHRTSNRWLGASDIAHLAATSVSNVYRLASENNWQRRSVGRRTLYWMSDVEETFSGRFGI